MYPFGEAGETHRYAPVPNFRGGAGRWSLLLMTAPRFQQNFVVQSQHYAGVEHIERDE